MTLTMNTGGYFFYGLSAYFENKPRFEINQNGVWINETYEDKISSVCGLPTGQYRIDPDVQRDVFGLGWQINLQCWTDE